MKIQLFTTRVDCFRSPAVLDRVRQRLRDGGTVAMATRDHPETLPDGVVHAGDDWAAVVAAGPALAVLDNLVFSDRRGRELRRWSGDEGRYRNTCAGVLGSVLNDLTDAGTTEVLLVSEEAEVSDGWREWMVRRSIVPHLPVPGMVEGLAPRRRWWLSNSANTNRSRYRYRDGRLLKPVAADSPRLLETEVCTPEAEVLLAIMAEYVAVRWDSRNPEDPRGLNQRYDMVHEILEAFVGTGGDSRVLLTAMEDLFDFVCEYVDFSRPRLDTGGKGG